MPRRLIADHRIVRGGGEIGLETLTAGREAISIEFWIVGRANAHAVPRKLWLVTINENHAFSDWVATKLPAIACCKRLYFRQEFGIDEFRGRT